MPDITVIIPSIPGRQVSLRRAMGSIRETGVDVQGFVQIDKEGEGAAVTRNRALEQVTTPLVAFLDDDDEFKPDHLAKCLMHMQATGSDLVYPWFDLNYGGTIRNDKDPLFINGEPAFGQPFDPEALNRNNYIPITVLAKTDMLKEVGGFPVPGSPEWPHPDCEDWGMWLRLREAGAQFSHLPERTWTWMVHGKNTSGRADNARKIYQ